MSANKSIEDIEIKIDPLKKGENENTQQYLWRVGKLIESGVYPNWETVTDRLNSEIYGDNIDKYKQESAYRKEVAAARRFFISGVFTSDTYEAVKQLREEQDNLYKIKKQVADQRREYRKLLTNECRKENIFDKLVEVTDNLNRECPLLDTPQIKYCSDKEALLCFQDWHYGMVTDNIWNTYNTNICKSRVKEVVEKTIEYLRLFNINKLHINSNGDLFNGAIHLSCRVASEENTVDQIVHVSEIVCEAIQELSKYVNEVIFYSNYGNHGRTIQIKEDSVNADNLERLLPWYIKARLQNNHKVTVIDSEYKEFTLIPICGYNVLSVHGDLDNVRDMATTFNTLFTRKYGKQIDLIVSADKHHIEEIEKFNIDAVIVPSLCGTDEYANNKRLYSSPAQTLMIFNRDEGRECTRVIKLK